MESVNLLNPAVLSFVGDAVYTLLVRTFVADKSRPSGELHDMAVEFVKASSQAAAARKIEPYMSEEEIAVFKRGRNFHTANTPKSATGGDYHAATGLECVFGFLHLSGKTERINELFGLITKEE